MYTAVSRRLAKCPVAVFPVINFAGLPVKGRHGDRVGLLKPWTWKTQNESYENSSLGLGTFWVFPFLAWK